MCVPHRSSFSSPRSWLLRWVLLASASPDRTPWYVRETLRSKGWSTWYNSGCCTHRRRQCYSLHQLAAGIGTKGTQFSMLILSLTGVCCFGSFRTFSVEPLFSQHTFEKIFVFQKNGKLNLVFWVVCVNILFLWIKTYSSKKKSRCVFNCN